MNVLIQSLHSSIVTPRQARLLRHYSLGMTDVKQNTELKGKRNLMLVMQADALVGVLITNQSRRPVLGQAINCNESSPVNVNNKLHKASTKGLGVKEQMRMVLI